MRTSTIRARTFCLLSIPIFLQLGMSETAGAQMLTSTYFPLAEGQFREYLENGSITVTKDVLEGLEDVNGIDTFVVETNGGEVGFGQERYTNDALGLQFHRASDAGGAGTFVPPLVILEDEFSVGQIFTSSGNVDFGGGFMIPYSSSTTIVGPATITVPAGTFDTIVIEATITINGLPTTDRLYLAEGIGGVRGEANIEVPGAITELVAVPEPQFAQGVLPGLVLLGSIGRMRRQRD